MSDLISREQVIKAISKLPVKVDDQGYTWMIAGDVLKQIDDIPSAEPEPKWIPVTERLPKKENKSYWVCTDTKYQCECRWTNNIYGIGESNDWGWKIFDIPQYTKVIAWMPLPEPYRGK